MNYWCNRSLFYSSSMNPLKWNSFYYVKIDVFKKKFILNHPFDIVPFFPFALVVKYYDEIFRIEHFALLSNTIFFDIDGLVKNKYGQLLFIQSISHGENCSFVTRRKLIKSKFHSISCHNFVKSRLLSIYWSIFIHFFPFQKRSFNEIFRIYQVVEYRWHMPFPLILLYQKYFVS